MSMYAQVTVIPHRYWLHKATGRRASIYGALPYQGDPDGWEVVESGFTYECVDHRGSTTIGACRVPAKTRDEAERVAELLRA